jgi:hypothetical protein
MDRRSHPIQEERAMRRMPSYILIALAIGLVFAAGRVERGLATPNVPPNFALGANSPNPVIHRTNIGLDLPERSQVHLAICDLQGREIAVLVDGVLDAGHQTVAWTLPAGANTPTGIYFYRADVAGLETNARSSQLRRLLVIR